MNYILIIVIIVILFIYLIYDNLIGNTSLAPEPLAPEPLAPEPLAPEPLAPEPLAPESIRTIKQKEQNTTQPTKKIFHFDQELPKTWFGRNPVCCKVNQMNHFLYENQLL